MNYEPVFWDIETTGLNPMAQDWWDGEDAAQVIAVGIGTIENWSDEPTTDEAEIDVRAVMSVDEYELLTTIGEAMRGSDFDDEPFLVGYNSRQFDHPYIGARFSRKRLDGEPFVSDWKRLDMMRAAGRDDIISKRFPKEDEYSEAVGVGVHDEFDGSQMPQAFKDGNWDMIEQHVTKDVEKMVKVFLERQDTMMDTFYDHYGINAGGGVVEEIDIPIDGG